MLSKLKLLIATLALSAALGGCAAFPLSQAETIEQRAYAAYGTFVIVEERIVLLTGPGSALSRDRQLQLIEAAERAQPTVDTLLRALEEYRDARASFENQILDKSAFAVIVQNLDRWTTTATPIIASLLASAR